MTLREIAHILDAEVLTGADKLDMEAVTACGELYLHGLPGTKAKGVQA